MAGRCGGEPSTSTGGSGRPRNGDGGAGGERAWASILPERDFCDGQSLSGKMPASEEMEASGEKFAAI